MHQLLVYVINDEKSAAALNINLSKYILLSGKNGCRKTAIVHLLKPFLHPKFDYKIKTCRDSTKIKQMFNVISFNSDTIDKR
jgi:hypothetical protein